MIVTRILKCRGRDDAGKAGFRSPTLDIYVVNHEGMERPYIVAGSLEKSVLCKFLTTSKDGQRDMCKAAYPNNPKKWGYCPYVRAI